MATPPITYRIAMNEIASRPAGAVLKHIVLCSFNSQTSAEQRRSVAEDFASLAKKIDVIDDLEYGVNNSPEGLNHDFEYCFTLSFGSEGGRDAYLVHPEHAAFVERLKPTLAKVLVVDYWAVKATA